LDKDQRQTQKISVLTMTKCTPRKDALSQHSHSGARSPPDRPTSAREATRPLIRTLSSGVCELFKRQGLLEGYEPNARSLFSKQTVDTYDAMLSDEAGTKFREIENFEQKALDVRFWQAKWDWVPLGTPEQHQAIADLCASEDDAVVHKKSKTKQTTA
jgi:hypothetical protein